MSTHAVTISCRAVYTDGSFLFDEDKLIATTDIREFLADDTLVAKDYRRIIIDIAVPRSKAEEFLDGLRSGKIELDVDSMKSPLEQS